MNESTRPYIESFLFLSLTRAGRSNPSVWEPAVEKHCDYFILFYFFVGWRGWIQNGSQNSVLPWYSSLKKKKPSRSWRVAIVDGDLSQRVLLIVKRALTHGQGLTASLGKKPILLVARILPCEGERLLIALQIYMSGSCSTCPHPFPFPTLGAINRLQLTHNKQRLQFAARVNYGSNSAGSEICTASKQEARLTLNNGSYSHLWMPKQLPGSNE